MDDEFKRLTFRELEEFYNENDYYHEQDPRNRMNFFNTDSPQERQERIQNKINEIKREDALEATGGMLEAMPMSREEGLERKKQIEDEDVKKGISKRVAKGGSMSKQMELFDEGGLKDEGGTVDPVSGNEVPPGSTQEEVRDDIPAQLSEGEFVFPADVVRYLGLEFLMNLRQKAKAGLKRMEEMGQMGNSDEATLPDDIPFTIDDLEMAEGGVVEAQAGTYIAPSIPVGRVDLQNQMSTPQTQQVNTPGVRRVGMANPYQSMGDPYAPVNYQQFLGASATGAPETETKTYTHPDGRVKTVTIIKATGKPLIPGEIDRITKDGFVEKIEPLKDEVKIEPIKQQTSRVKPVVEDSGGDGDDDNTGKLGGATMDVGGKSFALGYNFDGSITLTDPKTMESKTFSKDSQITKDAKAVTAGQMVDLAKLTPAGVKTAVVNSVLDRLGITIPGNTKIDDIKKKQKAAQKRLSETFVGVSKDPTEGLNLEDLDNIQKGLTDDSVSTTGKGATAQAPVTQKQARQQMQDRLASSGSAGEQSDPGGTAGGGGPQPDTSDMDSSFGGDGPSDSSSQSGDTGFGGGYGATYKGSLITRKQPSKKNTKKMKRGGLASKK